MCVCHLVEGVAADDNMKGDGASGWVSRKTIIFVTRRSGQLLLGCHQ